MPPSYGFNGIENICIRTLESIEEISMDKRFYKETEAIMMNVLENLKSYSNKLKEDRFNRLWKEVNIPCSLFDAINRLTKDEMNRIRKNYNFKNLSSLKKSELAMKLSELIPLEFKKIIYALDEDRYNFIKTIIVNSGVISYMDMSIEELETFMDYCLVFPGVSNDEKVLFIPTELAEVFSKLDGFCLERIVRRNTEWIKLTHGMLYYYGVMEAWAIKERIEELTKQEIDIMELMNVINKASDFYGQIDYSIYGYKNIYILEPQKIVEEHRKRPKVDYYPFTQKQLLKASDENYLDKTPEFNRFASFLLRNYDLSYDEIDEIGLHIITMINIDSRPTMIIEYLQNILEFPDFEFVQELTGKAMELHNGTRQWALKGHTPNELYQEERKFLNPLPSKDFKNRAEDSKVINLQTKNKIGRNDPCPCGSGKKYKKCCGKP